MTYKPNTDERALLELLNSKGGLSVPDIGRGIRKNDKVIHDLANVLNDHGYTRWHANKLTITDAGRATLTQPKG